MSQSLYSFPCFGDTNCSSLFLCFVAVVQSLSCDRLFVTPMDCSIPGSSVLQYFPEFAQAPVHWVDDAIQLPHPLLPSSPALHQVTKVLELQHKHQSFQWTFRVAYLHAYLVPQPGVLVSSFLHSRSLLVLQVPAQIPCLLRSQKRVLMYPLHWSTGSEPPDFSHTSYF